MNGKRLSPEKMQALHGDIRTRLQIERGIAENTQAVLEAELKVSVKIISNIEHGKYEALSPYKVNAELQHEIRRRRQIYNLGKEAMQGYTVDALADRHEMSASAVSKHIRSVKDQIIRESMQRIAA